MTIEVSCEIVHDMDFLLREISVIYSQRGLTAYCSQTLVLVERVPTKTHSHGEHLEIVHAETRLLIARWDYLCITIVDARCSGLTDGCNGIVWQICWS